MLSARAYKHYVLATLTAVYTFSMVDQSLIALLLQPIKQDLHLSDTELGVLTGTAFGLMYASLGIPFARWSDRGNRSAIAAAAISVWAAALMVCPFVKGFSQFVGARVAAAVGGAGSMPPTYSLVGDYFPESAERTRAMAAYMLANSLSFLLAFLAGGWLNERYGWRATFFLMGLPGLLLAGLVRLTVREPRRGAQHATRTLAPPPIRYVLATLWQQRASRHLSVAIVLISILGLALAPWYAAFMIRSHGVGTAQAGVLLGVTLGVGSLTGIWLGGYVAGRWLAHDEPGQMRLLATMTAALVPCFALFLLLPSRLSALIVSVPLMAVLCCYFGPTFALMQRLVAEDMRSTTLAIVMLLGNLIGMGAGPLLVGTLSDLLRPRFGADSLRYAMLTVSLLALYVAYHFWRAGETVKRDLARVARHISPIGDESDRGGMIARDPADAA